MLVKFFEFMLIKQCKLLNDKDKDEINILAGKGV